MTNDDLARREFITAYKEKSNTYEEYADSLLEHVEIGAVETRLHDLYKRLCDMHMEMVLTHGAQVGQGLAVAIKEIRTLLPEEPA